MGCLGRLFLAMLVTFLVYCLVCIFILYFSALPTVSVDPRSFISPFNLNASDPTITTNWTIYVRIKNPNSAIRFKYSHLTGDLHLAGDSSILSQAVSIPESFSEGPNGEETVRTAFEVPLPPAVWSVAAGEILVDVQVATKVKSSMVGGIGWRPEWMRYTCSSIRFVNSTSSGANWLKIGGMAPCKKTCSKRYHAC